MDTTTNRPVAILVIEPGAGPALVKVVCPNHTAGGDIDPLPLGGQVHLARIISTVIAVHTRRCGRCDLAFARQFADPSFQEQAEQEAATLMQQIAVQAYAQARRN